ncbi:MAG: helix-turn-helix transcriptional regulator [Clostridia bacterium]|nr:helix-turn-helix transcriptional regulator [Clostridia bacterium]
MDDVKIIIGNRIKFLRNNLKLSQEKLALNAELDRTYITSVERGKRNISIINIEKIANALNCTLSEFFYAPEFGANMMSLERSNLNKTIVKVAQKDELNYKV